jgi:hypothetical protein
MKRKKRSEKETKEAKRKTKQKYAEIIILKRSEGKTTFIFAWK